MNWTSTDIVRIGYVEESSGGVVLWIGVSYEDGTDVALQCKGLLLDHGIDDVEVEIRQSVLVHSAGLKLLQPAANIQQQKSARISPVTLGILICAQFAA